MKTTPIVLGQASLALAALYDTTINTAYGPVKGIAAFDSAPDPAISNWNDITVWKGIPFAADTSGANRWRPPQKRAAWNSTLYASDFGDTCPGQPSFGNVAKRQSAGNSSSTTTSSEDCLNLNVWTSANATDEKRPVMIWSYPAGGSAADALFDGAGMAAQGIVYVNYNYRNAAFGWLAHPQLAEEMAQEVGHNVSGNWAMLDQFAVLKWVHENIAAFGGDPDQITVAGQSAGSAATYHMLNSPLTKGLIKGAIIESGIRYPQDPFCSSLAENYRNMSTAVAAGEAFMESYNVTTIDELRQLSMEDINSYSGDFGAVLDYYAVPDTYYNTMLNGPANDVPVLTGNTKDESGAELPVNKTVAEYVQALQDYYGDELAKRFLALFPASNDTQASISYHDHYSATSRVGTWLFANGWDNSPTTSPIYSYFWDHAPPGQDRGAFHESEINYALDNLYGTDDYPWEDVDQTIAKKMSGYWANFVKTHNPNTGDSYDGSGELVQWNPSTPTKPVTMNLGNSFGDIRVATDAQIQLFKDFFATQRIY